MSEAEVGKRVLKSSIKPLMRFILEVIEAKKETSAKLKSSIKRQMRFILEVIEAKKETSAKLGGSKK